MNRLSFVNSKPETRDSLALQDGQSSSWNMDESYRIENSSLRSLEGACSSLRMDGSSYRSSGTNQSIVSRVNRSPRLKKHQRASLMANESLRRSIQTMDAPSLLIAHEELPVIRVSNGPAMRSSRGGCGEGRRRTKSKRNGKRPTKGRRRPEPNTHLELQIPDLSQY